jgi:hypothetical protein
MEWPRFARTKAPVGGAGGADGFVPRLELGLRVDLRCTAIQAALSLMTRELLLQFKSRDQECGPNG